MVQRLHTSLIEILDIERVPFSVGHRVATRAERLAAHAADALYVSTAAHRERMAPELGVAHAEISIVPLGLPDVTAPEARQVRPRNAAPVLLYLGRLEPRKGTLDLLHALPEIVQQVPNIKLVLIGQDRPMGPGQTTHGHYFAQAFPATLQKHVLFAGHLPQHEVDAWFARADLFVAPSIYESFGLIFAEAMRWSLPVVGTIAGGIPEVVEHRRTGLLVPPASPRLLAQAIVTLLTDEELRQRYAAAGRQRFELSFSCDVLAQRTAQFFRSVLAKTNQPAISTAPSSTRLAGIPSDEQR